MFQKPIVQYIIRKEFWRQFDAKTRLRFFTFFSVINCYVLLLSYVLVLRETWTIKVCFGSHFTLTFLDVGFVLQICDTECSSMVSFTSKVIANPFFFFSLFWFFIFSFLLFCYFMICVETCRTSNNESRNTNYFTNRVKKIIKNYFCCGSLQLLILFHFMLQVIRLYVNLIVL